MKDIDNNYKFELIEIFGIPMLFTPCRIKTPDTKIPEELFKYELRHDDDSMGNVCEIKKSILVNHFGTVLSKEEITSKIIDNFLFTIDDGIPIFENDYGYMEYDDITIQDYLNNYNKIKENN